MNHQLFTRPHNDYPPEFETFWQAYPSRPGNPKRAAFQVWQRLVRKGCDPQTIIDGAEAYHAYCEATGALDTPYVMMARTFIGPDMHFLEDWTPPQTKPEWTKIPAADDQLWDWAKQHGFPDPGHLTYQQYRKRLQNCVEARMKKATSGEPVA